MKKQKDIYIKEKKYPGQTHFNKGGSIRLSVIVPAYNEEDRIKETLESIDGYLEKQKYNYEIIVVANNCTDDTVGVVSACRKNIEHLYIYDLNILKPGGAKGYAVKKGIEKSRGDFVVFMDADNATRIDEMGKSWSYFDKGFDVVIGSRHIRGSNIVVNQPIHRRVLGRVANLIIRLLLLPGISDTQCGFKAFSGSAAKKIFSKSEIGGWGFDMEILALARHFGYKIAEVPVSWYEAGGSRLRAVKAARETLGELLKIRRNIRSGHYGGKK